MITFDTSLLTSYYQARAGVNLAASGGGSASGSGAKKAPTPPWSLTNPQVAVTSSDLVRRVMAGSKFVDVNAAKIDMAGAPEDYRKLFGLYRGLSALDGLADQMSAKGVSDAEKARIRARFAEGMKEIGSYLDTASFEKFQIAQGQIATKVSSSVGVKRETDIYTTMALHSGAAGDEVAAFQGDVRFTLEATLPSSAVKTVAFDLAEMGATPRTMSNVVLYLNGKLEAAGVSTRFVNQRIPGAPQTIMAGGKPVTLSTTPDSFALQIKGVGTETIRFSAPAEAPAVYLGGSLGVGGAATGARQVLKYQTTIGGPATASADGRVYAKTLSSEIKEVRQTKVAPDGSVYVLADVNGLTDGQTIKGSNDVALLKYDPAGNLVFTRTLGAASSANGFGLAISDDGARIAVAGQVTGALDLGDAGADAKTADSFVAVFDAEGQPVFTDRRGASAADEVRSLAFGANGALYVGGVASSAMAGASFGGQDNYVRSYAPTAPGAAQAYALGFTQQFGSSGSDKMAGVAVDGTSMVVAGVENGEAVVRLYALQPSGAPVLAQTRNLGALKGGLAGVGFAADGSIVVAGHTSDGAISAGTVTSAYDGGQSVFVAKLAADLTPSAADRLSFYGGGDRTAAALTVSEDGKVYVAGQIKVAAPPGQTTPAFDGYAAAIDADTGAVGWSTQFQGAGRLAAPTSIAVDATGASVLDRIGLPKGAIDWSGSSLVTAATSVRAGDQFNVRAGSGPSKAVTIEAADTLKTIADKINRALGFTAKVEVVIEKGFDRLRITPLNARTPIEIEAGKTGRDALVSLGLPEGMVALAADAKKKDKPQYALQLPSTINLDTDGRVKQAKAQVLTAIGAVKQIYRDLTAPPASATPGKTGGTVPTYLTDQIASYQRALARLGG